MNPHGLYISAINTLKAGNQRSLRIINSLPYKIQKWIGILCLSLSIFIVLFHHYASSSDLSYQTARVSSGLKTLDVLVYWQIVPNESGLTLYSYFVPHHSLYPRFRNALGVQQDVVVEMQTIIRRHSDIDLIKPIITNTIHNLRAGLPLQYPVKVFNMLTLGKRSYVSDMRMNHGFAGITPYSLTFFLSFFLLLLFTFFFNVFGSKNQYRLHVSVASIVLSFAICNFADYWHTLSTQGEIELYKLVHVDKSVQLYVPSRT